MYPRIGLKLGPPQCSTLRMISAIMSLYIQLQRQYYTIALAWQLECTVSIVFHSPRTNDHAAQDPRNLMGEIVKLVVGILVYQYIWNSSMSPPQFDPTVLSTNVAVQQSRLGFPPCGLR